MQGLAGKAGGRGISGFLASVLARGGLAGAAIERIADQGVAQMGQMDPDLMGAPGLQPALDQGGKGPVLPGPNRSSTR